MSNKVLDSSAILAVIFEEPGSEVVAPLLKDGLVSSVNFAEVTTKLAEKKILTRDSVEDLKNLGFDVIDFDVEQAAKVGELRPLTKHLGLSLGDRCCLALAILRGTTAVTADKDWKKLKFCKVEVIR